ncbi:succinate dehydrogenase iron-sulfur subunit [Strigomonas culicis]|uniref:Succinate dehydrogenase iron-sulfur subunit n=2 Tax=Strigomonas culicis TaxID=28005 RepID=S9WB92_9TRYP|nr:succinate dehydrogenase iron-sulfur subunit [Strigomonas culicis]|eukprot:EPY36371.1 succinate dehydrogenase iron-sulfur subunit [Strigomonas culicis]
MLRKFAPRPYKTTVRRLAATEAHAGKPASKAVLQLIRYDPERNATRVESYEYDKHHDYMVLDLLIAVKAHQDPTLAFRSSCCEGVCGSCAMNINGINSLACITFAQHHTTVGPLPNFPVIKDFVVDLRHFFQQYAYIRPFVRNVNLHRNQIDGIVSRYENISRALTGVTPQVGAALTQPKEETAEIETEIVAGLRIADALSESGNVTQLLNALERLERGGLVLDNNGVISLLNETLDNYARRHKA